MDAPTTHATEIVTGLGGTGVQLIVAYAGSSPIQAHPMVPTLQIGDGSRPRPGSDLDLDLLLDPAAGDDATADAIERLIARAASRDYVPRLYGAGVVDFQLTRGRLGVSV